MLEQLTTFGFKHSLRKAHEAFHESTLTLWQGKSATTGWTLIDSSDRCGPVAELTARIPGVVANPVGIERGSIELVFTLARMRIRETSLHYQPWITFRNFRKEPDS